jgi:hypothetical protein
MIRAHRRRRSLRLSIRITREACSAGSRLSAASTRTSPRRRRMTSRSKPICERSKRGSQARAISGMRWRCTTPADPAGASRAHLRAAAISECRALGRTQGNRDEETACYGIDRRVIYFARSEGSGPCRRRCLGRSVGSGRFGTGGRGGRCVHRIYGRTCDRAFLGSAAVRFAIAGAARNTIQPRCPGSNGRQGKSAAKHATTCQDSGNPCRHKIRAACSGI